MKTEEKQHLLTKKIVFYDGDCGFCSKSVQLILRKRTKQVYFIPLQSELAESLLNNFEISIELNTFYFLNEKLYQKSTAALQVSKHLKQPYPLLFYLFIWIPSKWRDEIYDFVAKRRNKIAGKSCYLPNEKERSLFLGIEKTTD